MRYKATFGAGFALGYTLGARAGRERYEQIMRLTKGLLESPAVQETAGVLQAQAGELVQTARRTVTDKVAQHLGGKDVTDEVSPYPARSASPNGTG